MLPIHTPRTWILCCGGLLLTLGAFPGSVTALAALPAATVPATAVSAPAASSAPTGGEKAETAATLPSGRTTAPQGDPAAGRYMTSCVGCHSLFGAKLTGPELSHVAAWPGEQLKTAIKRMQEKVGPMREEDINALTDLLRSATVRDRLKAEETRLQAQFRAKLAPPDPAVGRALFLGRTPLAHGGLACYACHAAEGVGGNLGPDLTGVHAKMGDTPLVSAIEKSNFKVMAPHYSRHPVTTQEAMHLARYFSTLDPAQAAPAAASFLPLGGGVAVALLAGLVFHFRAERKRRGRDTTLQQRRK